MADDELDSLYCVQPDAFTAQRTKLSAAAKQRGDAAAARRISAARKPTAAAWIVNRLALRDKDAKRRLTDLGDRLRDAHAAMDGDRIRDLSAEQHQLINELARAAFKTADVSNPSSTVRDDVTSTLQAAIADPEVTVRLGRLTQAERWSGFGAFGDTAPVAKTQSEPRRSPAKAATKPPRDERDKEAKEATEAKAADERREKLQAAVAAAERAKAQADDVLSQRQAERDSARLRRDEAAARLRDAEREFHGAENRYEKAHRASRAAAESVKQAKAALRRA